MKAVFHFSKSKYCLAWQCPKLLWLSKYKPECKPQDASLEARFRTGNSVGDLAMGLFREYTEVTAFQEDGKQDLDKMKERTKECVENGTQTLCEASFDYNGLYCAVDILRKEKNGWAIYEVKSSTHASQVYSADIAYQKYVLEHCGIPVTGTYLVCINSDYVRGQELDLQQLFQIIDLSVEVAEEIKKVPDLLAEAESVCALADEPAIGIGTHCRDPYDCGFWDYCTRDLPKPNVFDLYRIDFKKALELCRQGKAGFDTLLYDNSITNAKHKRHMLHAVSEQPDEVDAEHIKEYLDTLSYPLYFLDFETMQLPVPEFEGTRPYEQVPFQYSLHYIEYEGGPLLHKEFLAESGTDPRRAIAERLCEDIPKDVCTTAYNKGFECTEHWI